MSWQDDMSPRLHHVASQFADVTDDVAAGADVVLRESDLLVPKESGRLSATGTIDRGRGGPNSVAITYSGPYARYQHEHLFFKHSHGGQAKYLETALLTRGARAIRDAAERVWSRL